MSDSSDGLIGGVITIVVLVVSIALIALPTWGFIHLAAALGGKPDPVWTEVVRRGWGYRVQRTSMSLSMNRPLIAGEYLYCETKAETQPSPQRPIAMLCGEGDWDVIDYKDLAKQYDGTTEPAERTFVAPGYPLYRLDAKYYGLTFGQSREGTPLTKLLWTCRWQPNEDVTLSCR